MTLGQNIRYWRRIRGLSRNELAKKAATTHSYIGKLEMGQSSPTIEFLKRIAKALEVKPSELDWELEGDEIEKLREPGEAEERMVSRFFRHLDPESRKMVLRQLRLLYEDDRKNFEIANEPMRPDAA